MSKKAKEEMRFDYLPKLTDLSLMLERDNPAIFMSPGGPDGEREGVTVWEHGTTNSTYFPKKVVNQLIDKVLAVTNGDSNAEMIQR